MDDLGSVIYLILIIAFSLIGFLKSKKKAAPKEVIPSDNHGENDFENGGVDELLEVLMSKGRAKKVERKNTMPERTTKPQFSSVKAPEKKVFKHKEVLKQEDEDSSETIELSLNSREELQKAFIYSEIFQRRYE